MSIWWSLLLFVVGAGPMLGLAVLFRPSILPVGIYGVIATVVAWGWRGTQYTSLDIHGDRIRLTRILGPPRVVGLSQLKKLGPLEFASDAEHAHAVAFTELLDYRCFERAGGSTGAHVCEAEDVGSHKRYAAIIGLDHALVIDETPDALDAAVGRHCAGTLPRAHALALILVRLPEDDRALVVKRLTVAGLARTVPRDDFYRDFRTL